MITVEILKKVSLCCQLTDRDLDKLAFILSKNAFVKNVDANESLMKMGERPRYIYLLESGMVRTVNYTAAGEEIFFYYFSEGTLIGILNVIGKANNYSEYISMKKSRLYAIPAENLNCALDTLPAFTRVVLEDVSRKSIELVQLIVISRRKKTRDRICSYLYMNYAKTKETTYHTPFTIEMLAKTLNLTRSALSKELHMLENEGLISIAKNKIYLKNPEKLEDSLFQ